MREQRRWRALGIVVPKRSPYDVPVTVRPTGSAAYLDGVRPAGDGWSQSESNVVLDGLRERHRTAAHLLSSGRVN